jgi:hypothetical protein
MRFSLLARTSRGAASSALVEHLPCVQAATLRHITSMGNVQTCPNFVNAGMIGRKVVDVKHIEGFARRQCERRQHSAELCRKRRRAMEANWQQMQDGVTSWQRAPSSSKVKACAIFSRVAVCAGVVGNASSGHDFSACTVLLSIAA